MTRPKEKETKSRRVVVNVPVSVVISVPVECETSIPGEDMVYNEELGSWVVDVLEHSEIVEAAMVAANKSDVVTGAFDSLVGAAIRFKEKYPSLDVYGTLFAGLVKEAKF